jgi:gamma-glutamyltranspeptidase/glutathione hydrolase
MRCGVLALATSIFLTAAAPSQAADLSPTHWPEVQRVELQTRELSFVPKEEREVHGAVLITGTASPVAIHAGMEALRQGGSASDAATVVALTQIARTMGATVSYAGKMAVAYYDAKTGTVSFLDAGWSPYAGERDIGSIPDLGAEAAVDALGRQTLVPGFMRGAEALHDRFGRLPWADLFAPAIWSAETGVEGSPAIRGMRRTNAARFARTPEGRRWLTGTDGQPVRRGDLIRQPELVRTLRAVARGGADEMYRGAWAKDYVATVRAYGGRANLQDLERYRPRWRAPISAGFADATVFSMSTSYLACSSLTSLNLLDSMQAREMGPYWKDPAAFRAYARAIQYATLRQVLRVSPTAFERKAGLPAASCADRLTKPYAEALASELMKTEPSPFDDSPIVTPEAGHHTMAVVVVDAKGDVAVLVHSTNGEPTGIVVDGVPIPEAATVNKWALRTAHAGDLLNDLAPMVALRHGRPVAAVGGTATSLMPETVRLIGEILSSHATLAAITAAPPLLYNFQPPKSVNEFASWPVLTPAGAYDAAFQQRLSALGVSIKEEPRNLAWGPLRGTAAAAVIDLTTGAATAIEVPVIEMFAESER